MKYSLIQDLDIWTDPIDQVFKNRGIDNISEFKKPSKSNLIHFSKLKNINKAVNCLIKHVREGGEAFIQIDADP